MCIFNFFKAIKKRKLEKQISNLQYQLELLDQQAQRCLRNAEDIKFMIDSTKHDVLTEDNLQINLLYNQNIDTWLKNYFDYRNKANRFMVRHSMVAKKIEQLEKCLENL